MQAATTDTYVYLKYRSKVLSAGQKTLTPPFEIAQKAQKNSTRHQQCKNYMNIDQKLFLMIRKHKITTIASWNYQHLYIYLKYRAKALYNDWETQHSKNCRLKLSRSVFTDRRASPPPFEKAQKVQNSSTRHQECKNYKNHHLLTYF